jgi:hypothetical protein
MTQNQTFAIVPVLLTLILSLASAQAADDTYSEAQAGLAGAYSDYYRELRKNPGFSQDQAKEVADRILSPANAKIARALEEDFRRTYENQSYAEKEPARSSKKGARLPAGEASTVEEISIDGSNIPAEVEFPGRTKK